MNKQEKYKAQDSFEEYLAHPGFQSSDLTLLAKSPKHYWDYKNNPVEDAEETKAQFLGSAIHKLILEPATFYKCYSFFDRDSVLPHPEKDYRTPANAKARDDFYAEAAERGMKLLSPEEWEQVVGMSKSVTDNPTFMTMIQGNVTEESHYFHSDELGMDVKIRPDSLNHVRFDAISLKSTVDASPEGFAKQIVKYGYHYKEALYFDLLSEFYGKPLNSLVFVAIESKAPYYHGIYNISEDVLERGRYEYKAYIQRLKNAIESNSWKGYEMYADNSFGIVNINLPKWVNTEIII